MGLTVPEGPILFGHFDKAYEYVFTAHVKTGMQTVRYGPEQVLFLFHGPALVKSYVDENHVVGAADAQIFGVCNKCVGLVFLNDLESVVRSYSHDINESAIYDIADLGAVFRARAFQ
ncbi:hypothetical protein QK292_16795 [Arthrobacter sp. AL08]|uniref:hypothetical protein n=1 Tax=unclassified Arthrobacter TaxID=235627 RepID=UPI00249A90B6|nr:MULTISPECIES: hypothetical protein [unclassified Arthrobacter]MDI3243210.1 hypothetical protein [Arthrobacter sp. AL05]MDI3279220.1 hypothetical protein [Arthrobacter sp. AL08]